MDNSTPNMPDKLVQYLDNELYGMEKESLEQQLKADNALRAEFNSLVLTREAVRMYGLREKVAGIHQYMMAQIGSPAKEIRIAGSRRKIFRYSIAVAACLILLVGAYMILTTSNPSAEKVFASHYRTYELVTSRDDSTVETPVEKAYREKNYAEVVRLHDAGDHSVKAEFLCGAAALEIKNNTKAIKCFKEVLDLPDAGILYDQAEYYLSLSYIRNTDYNNALMILNKIRQDPSHLYNQEVNDKLIRQVRKLQKDKS